MKKIVAFIAAAVLVLCMGIGVTADEEVSTPWDDGGMKIAVVETFDNDEGIVSGYIGMQNTEIEKEDLLLDYAELWEGGIYFGLMALQQVWVGLVDTNLQQAPANAEGFGFYVKNDSGFDAEFSFELCVAKDGNLNNGAYTIGSNKSYALISKDGAKTIVTAPEQEHPYAPGTIVHSYFEIPEDFEGWVCVPLENLQKNFDSQMFVEADVLTKLTGFGWLSKEGSELLFDNLFFYGSEVEAKNADLIPTDMSSATSAPEQPDASEQPTADASAAASAAPSAGTDAPAPSNNTVLYIVIAAVAVVAVVVVAVVLANKKKKTDKAE
ncbi:MAG: hypothetical protein KH354_01915 [Clostridiales bacterium]|nr:hypothetical protein [Clostridiales bacterium]